MDLVRLGAVLRAVRIRQRLRQQDVAMRADVSRTTVARAEAGQLRSMTLGTLLDIAGALGVRLDVDPRWRGGDLGRLLNSGHAAMHDRVAGILGRLPEWIAQPEVSFAIYGERGVIDILAFHPMTRALLVVELKTELVDVNALMGTVDRYTRLAGRVAAERGWRAFTVGCWVILRDTMSNRRRVAAHAHVLRAAFPMDGREMRAWLRNPGSARVRGLSFLSDAHRGSVSGPRAGVRRVRAPSTHEATLSGTILAVNSYQPLPLVPPG